MSGFNQRQVIMGNEFSCNERNFLPTPTENSTPTKNSEQEDDGTDDYLEARDCWDFMCNGCKLIKIRRLKKQKHKGKKKYFILDEDLLGFRYKPCNKPKGYKVSINMIKDVLSGSSLPPDDIISKYHRDCQIVILYEKKNVLTKMHLVTFSIEAASKWAFGLQAMIKRKGLLLSKPDPLRDEWLKAAFQEFDADGNGALSLTEVENLLLSLNIDLESKILKMLFNEANIQGIQGHKNGTLTKEEFADFFKRISTREEIVILLERFAENNTNLTLEEFKTFLSSKQLMQGVTNEMAREIIDKFEPVKECKESARLGIDGLTKFLLSDEGNILISKCKEVYHDMNQPLSHYFIASSHNTYLLEDQLRGPSCVSAYVSALKQGCRCVELDCWDGEDNEPVIYHGYTFTSKILFKDVIAAIKEHAFCSSPYPLILSLENHCSIDQQKVMAKHLVKILGDLLFAEPIDESLASLPSPESLKYKILLKGKKLSMEKEKDDDDLGDVSDEDEAAEMVIQDGDDVDGLKRDKQKEKEKSERPNGVIRRISVSRSLNRGSKYGNLKLAKELSRLVNYISSVKFQSFEQAQAKNKFYQMSSFGESKFIALGDSEGNSFVKHNTKFLSRTYPGGIRVDSSNYNPQDAWNLGCQIAALNYQTDGQMMDLYRGKFTDNANCGYLLKPCFMRDESSKFDPRSDSWIDSQDETRVHIQIISGQQLPKSNSSKQRKVIDPYVLVETFGVPCDTNEKLYCTKTIHNNGFNPVWNEDLSFSVKVPELALIRFAVYDSDLGSDDFLAQFTAPLSCLNQGYRHIRLLSRQGTVVPNATLFVRVTFDLTAG
ncbi:1-phosphatidylinositol 4,5-bisphosphate phosphodiesterase zeta-1-like isoform X1 [Rhopilema esculentum]|uniref:1-phosphatidylinositol 4,5-bisphosphate phosphodiesterase zeta-1-like isoform X1 n=2 Tax=Rhopilema esculentum TaxID=499914 RepID=UPI0031D59A65